MSFDVENINQASNFISENIYYPMYSNLQEKSKRANYLFLIAPMVGFADFSISSIQAIAGMSEAIIKGLSNIFGSCRFDSCNLKRGILQIVLGVPLIALPAIPIIVLRTARILVKFFLDPQKLTEVQLEALKPKTPNEMSVLV